MNNLIEAFTIYSTGNNFVLPILLIISFFAGILASLSPCTLGILPLIIGYVGGYSKENNKRLFLQMLSFSFGLSTILSIIGVVCAITGRAFTSFASPIVIILFASVILLMGLNLLGFVEIKFPTIVKKMPQNKNGSIFVFPFIVGTLFALASSPCSSPILASIMAIATISGSIIFAISLLFAFAAGQCVIIIVFALFTSTLKNAGKFAKYSEILIKISGILLILTALAIFYTIFSNI